MSSKKFALFAVVFVAIAMLVVACGGGGTSGGGGNAQDITITATDFKFDPNTINATAGQTINVTLVNKGSATHTFVVKDAGNFKISADAGQSTKGTFTAPAAGTYQFICDVPGHAEQGMTGQLIVK